jgi:hypothetical protein
MKRSMTSAFAPLILLIAPLAGCGDAWNGQSGEQQIARLKAERARADPPAFWSIAVLGETHPGRPVLICANRRMVSGFTSIQPAGGGQDCTPLDAMVPTENGAHYRCKLGAVVYAVSSASTGDLTRDFQVSSSAYTILDAGPQYARTLRFKRLASACPAGWGLGQATDQAGRLTQAFDPEGE